MEETAKTTALLCGFGKREITPPIGTSIAGYFRARYAKGVIDPLFVRAAFFQSGEKRVLILTMDIIGIGPWSERIREKVGKNFDVDPNAILIIGTHTHTGPLHTPSPSTGMTVDPAYIDFLVEQAYCAAGEASVDLKPARLFYTETEAKGISFVRRYRMKDGTYMTNPNPSISDQIDSPVGTPNEALRILKIRREGADDIYMVNYGTHADTIGGEYISADWPGFVCSILEAAIPGSRGMFLLGPEGDANHFNPYKEKRGKVISEKRDEDVKETAAHARYMGRVIVGELLKVCDHMEELSNEGVDFAVKEMRLPSNKTTDPAELEEAAKIRELHLAGKAKEAGYGQAQVAKSFRILRMMEAPPYFSHNAYALRIGGFAIVGGPGEPFTELGRRIYAASPFPHAMVTCMTNGSCGYVPAGSAYEEGGYEANNSNYLKGTDDVYVQTAIDALNALK